MEPYNPRLLKNNFDLLRCLFAGTVCLVHVSALSGFQELQWIVDYLSAEVAVKAFFVVSGFLIFMSYQRSTSIVSYAGKRFRRIYPAYATIVLGCAIGLISVSSLGPSEYFSGAWLKYVAANLTFFNFLQPYLPGVFENHAFPHINGALWTLKIEVMFYMAVPLFVYLFQKTSRMWVMVFTYCASVGYAEIMTLAAHHYESELYLQVARQLPGQMSYFMAGAFLFYYLPVFERFAAFFVIGAGVVLVLERFFPLPLFEPMALAIVVVFFGLFVYLGNFGRFGDFSYGIYIIHFPAIQLLLHWGWFREAPWLFLGAVVCITLTGATAMWHWVEKRYLLRSSHYVVSTVSPIH